MRLKLLLGLAAACLAVLPAASFAQENANKPSEPSATVKAFYNLHFQRKCDFSLPGLKLEHRLLDDKLYNLLVAQLKKPVKKGDAPDLDGDPFTNSQDPPDTFSLGASKQDETTASVAVTLLWKEKNKIVDQRNIDVKLAKTAAGWKIANIISGNTDDDDLVRLLKHISKP